MFCDEILINTAFDNKSVLLCMFRQRWEAIDAEERVFKINEQLDFTL